MRRLNVVSATGDRELDAVRRVVDVFDTASGLDGVIAVLHARATRRARCELVDVIGHGRAPGFVMVGTWAIDDSPQTTASFSLLLRPVLRQLGARTIRLLGCSTATTERGRDAMRRIARATGCRVLGTARAISSGDYDAAGFASDHALVDADGRRG